MDCITLINIGCSREKERLKVRYDSKIQIMAIGRENMFGKQLVIVLRMGRLKGFIENFGRIWR